MLERQIAIAAAFSLVMVGGSASPHVDQANDDTFRSIDKGVAKLPGPLGGFLGLTLGVGPYWYKNIPGYLPEVYRQEADHKAFSNFMNHYRENRDLTEEERIDVIIELGIPAYAPNWLPPETRRKIFRRLHNLPVGWRGRAHWHALPDGYIELASVQSATTAQDFGHAYGGAEWFATDAEFIGAARAVGIALLFVPGIGEAEMISMAAFVILADPSLNQIKQDLTPEAAKAISERETRICQIHACSTTKPPSVIPKTKPVVVIRTLGVCTEDQNNDLLERQQSSCRKASRCDGNETDKSVISKKIDAIELCIISRKNVMEICFPPGTNNPSFQGHKQATDDWTNARKNCILIKEHLDRITP